MALYKFRIIIISSSSSNSHGHISSVRDVDVALQWVGRRMSVRRRRRSIAKALLAAFNRW